MTLLSDSLSNPEPLYRHLVTTLNQKLRSDSDGRTGFCILATATLLEVLNQLELPAQPLRVEAVVYPPPGRPSDHYPCALGSDGDGTRRPAAKPDHWRGHLALVTYDNFLLDATLDQVNESNPWLEARPFVASIAPDFPVAWFGLEPGNETWHALASWQTPWPSTRVRYLAFPGRGGFKSAPDWRPSHRRELVEYVLSELH